MADLERKIEELKAYLLKYQENPKAEKILYAFKKLDRYNITLDILQSTGVGKTVNGFRKHEGDVGKRARELVGKWKQLVNSAQNADDDVSKRHTGLQSETVSETTYGSHSGRLTQRLDDSHSGRLTQRLDDVNRVPYMDSNVKTEPEVKQEQVKVKQESPKVKQEPSEEAKQVTVKQEPSGEKNSKHKSRELSKSTSDKRGNHGDKQSDKRSDKHGDKARREKKRERPEEEEERARKRARLEEEKTDGEKVKVKEEKEEKKENDLLPGVVVKEEKEERKKSSHHSNGEKNRSGESERHHKHSKKQTDGHNKHDKQRGEGREKQREEGREKQREEKKREKERSPDCGESFNLDKVKPEPSDKVKNKTETVKIKSEPEDKVKIKTEKTSDSSKRHKTDDHKTKTSHSAEKKPGSAEKKPSSAEKKPSSRHSKSSSDKSSSKGKSSSKSSSRSKHKPSSSKVKTNVEEFDMFSMPNGNDDDDDVIDGGDETLVTNVKVERDETTSERRKDKKNFTIKNASKPGGGGGGGGVVGGFTTEAKPSLLSPPPKPLHSLVSDEDILGSLPEPSPNYKPLPYLDLDTLEKNAEKRATDTEIAFKKNCRTQVYSGRRNKFLTSVPSLYDSCIQVLKDNIDALDYVGGVPYDIMKPVLELCTPTQLYNIEDVNPQFIGETDELWKNHCKKEFRKDNPEQFESWREMFIRCHDARDAKLKSLTQTISASVAKAKEPVRTTKLAYIDIAAKPPRDVRRRQRIHGTAGPSKQDPLHRLTSHGSHVTKQPRHNLLTSNPNVSTSLKRHRDDRGPKMMAPMMRKTLKFMRKLKRK